MFNLIQWLYHCMYNYTWHSLCKGKIHACIYYDKLLFFFFIYFIPLNRYNYIYTKKNNCLEHFHRGKRIYSYLTLEVWKMMFVIFAHKQNHQNKIFYKCRLHYWCWSFEKFLYRWANIEMKLILRRTVRA